MTIAGDLTIDAPGGGTIRMHDRDGVLVVHCSDGPSLWALVRVAYRSTNSRATRRFRKLRNPLGQRVEVFIGHEPLFHWDSGSLPRPDKLSTFLRWLGKRR
ncbi:MAG: hypothetical protein WBA17_08125 [Saprospiraceae bacterium]